MHYPLQKRIEEALIIKDQTKTWLSKEVSISLKSIYNLQEIGNISLDTILNLSKALDFNFLEDYNKWLKETGEPAISKWQEDEINYTRTVKKEMTMTLHLRGEQSAIGMNMDKVLTTLRNECDKYGLEII